MATLRQRHERVATALLPRGPARRAALAAVDASVGEFEEILAAVAILQHLSPRTRDLIVARGERLSATLLAAAVTRAGRRAVYVDAPDVVVTDDQHGGASPRDRADHSPGDPAAAPAPDAPDGCRSCRATSAAPPTAASPRSGRGGSDLTATLLARALGAEVVSLWKDVPGILTSDPRLVPDARLIPQLHHQEAAEVAHYGAKVLHPRALIPISGTRITLEVRSFLDPSRPGTTVAGRLVSPQYPVKAVAVLPLQAVVTVAGKGMVGVHGIAARTFAAVDAERLSVSTIFQASSESSIGFTVPEAEADRAVASLRRAFAAEIATGADRQRQRAARAGGHRRRRRRHGRHAGDRRARLHRARDQRRQRRRHRPGLVGAQHHVRRHRRGRRRGGAQGARRVPALEDRRRPAAGAAVAPTSCCSASAASAGRSPS